ncbi:MAG: hypothetical protein COB36_11475 [Alphaproteobacteria bacterium]|nr:MAG: hypothetical protein COB36_11475 [Alphaproteobacteria bacterium]
MAKKKEIRFAFKGFDKDLKCRDFQYEVGKTYKHKGKVEACRSGFHSCEHPFDVWGYYSPGENRFALVELGGKIKDHSGDTKLASAEITIKAELTIPEFVQRGVDYILSKIKDTKTESNTGDRSAATNTGDRSAATNTGDQSAATNTGDQSAATNTGDRSAASVDGEHSVALASGYQSKAKASLGSAICLVERNDDMEIINVFAGIAKKRGKIKPDTWYTLKGGKPVEAA